MIFVVICLSRMLNGQVMKIGMSQGERRVERIAMGVSIEYELDYQEVKGSCGISVTAYIEHKPERATN